MNLRKGRRYAFTVDSGTPDYIDGDDQGWACDRETKMLLRSNETMRRSEWPIPPPTKTVRVTLLRQGYKNYR